MATIYHVIHAAAAADPTPNPSNARAARSTTSSMPGRYLPSPILKPTAFEKKIDECIPSLFNERVKHRAAIMI